MNYGDETLRQERVYRFDACVHISRRMFSRQCWTNFRIFFQKIVKTDCAPIFSPERRARKSWVCLAASPRSRARRQTRRQAWVAFRQSLEEKRLRFPFPTIMALAATLEDERCFS
jgi:hypothetical protein